jgi:hypothetical protein
MEEEYCCIVPIILIFLLGLLIFGASAWIDCGKAKYWIDQAGSMNSATSIVKEENGCVYYIDAWTDKEGKTCGAYSIKDWSNK